MNKFENTILKTKFQNLIHKSQFSESTKFLEGAYTILDAHTLPEIHLPAVEEQMIQHLIAQFDVLPDERKTWALYHLIRSLTSIPEVEAEMKKIYNPTNYEVLQNHLHQYQRGVEQLKIDLDQLETKKDKNLTTPAYKRSVETLKNISLIQEELYTALYYLLSIVYISKIPSSILNIHVQLRKEIQYDLDKKEKNQNTTPEGTPTK